MIRQRLMNGLRFVGMALALFWAGGVLVHPPAQGATTVLFVNGASTAVAPDGQSWATAYPFVQDALTAAGSPANGDVVEIWVAQGVYYPDDGANQTADDIAATFVMTSNVQLYGGFTGTETSREARDWLASPTILSGDLEQNDVTVGGIITDTNQVVGDNSHNVVWAIDTNSQAVLDGFVVTGGRSPLAGGAGGGIRAWNSGSFTSVLGIRLRNLHLIGNHGGSRGGGADIVGRITLENSVVENNRARNAAGLMLVGSGAHNVVVRGNATVLYNNFQGSGGGIYSGLGGTVSNAVVTGNFAGMGGGIFAQSNPRLLNVTVSGNVATEFGGGVLNSGTNLLVQNSIIWHNEDSTGVGTTSASIGVDPNATDVGATISHSLVEGSQGSGVNWEVALGTDGGGNVDELPKFVAPILTTAVPTAEGDFRPLLYSVVINKGDNTAAASLATDVAGNARVEHGTVDMGAYEVVVAEWSDLAPTVREGETSVAVTLTLLYPPTAVVTVDVVPQNEQCAVSTGELLFGVGETTQMVHITAVDDLLEDGDQSCPIVVGSTASAAHPYDGLALKSVIVLVLDNDSTTYLPLVVR